METPASGRQSNRRQLPDPCITFGIELPDPRTAFQLEAAGVEPELPNACTKIKLIEAAAVEPKPEPCDCEEDDAPLSPGDAAAADDWEISPLSGDHPFFTTVLSRTQLQKHFQLAIPPRFQRHLPAARVPAVLRYGGRSWTASYRGDLKLRKLDTAAWRDFAVDNRLRVGDACVFELLVTGAGARTETEPESEEARNRRDSDMKEEKEMVFRVQVLRGGLPQEVTSKGDTADEPLVIVD